MKEFWSPRIRDMVPYTPGEQPKDRKFIKLNTNENPYPPSAEALAAIREAAGEGLRLYPDPDGADLREALAACYGVKESQIFLGNGSDEILAFAFQALFDPEKEIVFPDITYSFYPVYAALFGQRFREIPLDEHFGVPVDQFLGNNGGVVLANPNAPTGREIPLSDIREILSCNPDVAVVIDEAYVDFGASSALELLDRYPNLFFDITPGWEMFENFAKDRDYWRHFFDKYSHKILYGTDTFSDHWRETVSCLRRVMETDEAFTAFEENCIGLDLPETPLRDIYFNNYYKFIRRTDKKIDVGMILKYADTLYDRIPAGKDAELIRHNIDFLKAEIAKFQ